MEITVWDFNGVVVDDIDAHRIAFSAVLTRIFNKPPIDCIDDTRRRTTVPYSAGFLAAGIDEADLKARLHEIDNLYHGAYLNHPHALRARDGIYDALAVVEQLGGRNILLSNTRPDVLEHQLDQLGLSRAFAWKSCCEKRMETGFRFSKSGRLQAYFNGLCQSPVRGIIVGDSIEEPMVAKELGLASIALTGGWFDHDRLAASGADYLAHSLAEVAKIIRTHRFTL
ncbi:MAG: HAD family hydrolase [Rhodospirillales bacterium]|nr:HAD family hydrolase [Alphaproteobacteria bacterium]MCB9987199.1 HAD family hydrolase [Rhodospirillales bacterium]USO07939.1 MAG: HAD family hydrolase [Rhodospirillales bacterium]